MIGIDIEQYLADPYGSGIQRVLQYLAKAWPSEVPARFVIPTPGRPGELLLIEPEQAGDLISISFRRRVEQEDVREDVLAQVVAADYPSIREADLATTFDAWLLPEVSYLPTVLERFESMRRQVRTAMIGYDTLPMTEPANYRFRPGMAGWVSEYFRLLAVTDHVICISDYAKQEILGRLRRDPSLGISVAHPGGDHLPIRPGNPPERTRFTRLGTMEARKQPVEILTGFIRAVDEGLDAELLFIGKRNASDESVNQAVYRAIDAGYPVTWIQGASDDEVYDLVNHSSVFLSIGIEGYGIPVLEAIRLGTPVLYDGVQPAGELMEGLGARRVDAGTEVGLTRLFHDGGGSDAVTGLRAHVRPEAVPTWSAFAADVAGGVSGPRNAESGRG